MLPEFQNSKCSLEINLILIKPSLLSCIIHPSLHSRACLESLPFIRLELRQVFKKLNKRHLRRLIRSVIVQSRLKQVIRLRLRELVYHCESFFGHDAWLDIIFLLLIPLLLTVINLPQEMGSNLMVKERNNGFSAVIRRDLYIDLAFACFIIVGHTGRNQLIRVEVNYHLIFQSQLSQVLFHKFLCLVLINFLAKRS